MNTRLKRFLVVLAGIVIPAIPLVAASPAFRGFLDHHPVISAYLALAAPILTAVYRELVAWRQPPAV